MKLIVLGNYGTFPGRDGACSGYLLQDDNINILIDCGNGVMSRLQRYCKIEDLDAIVLSHLHRDHTSDMHILKYAVETKMYFKTISAPINVYAPPTPKDEYNSLIYKGVFNLSKIHDNMNINIKGIDIKFFSMKHSVETYGMRIEYKGCTLSYTADTLYNENIINLAKEADVFLCESTVTERERSNSDIPHMSAKQAAKSARDANVKSLLLTHFWFEEDRVKYLQEASPIFPEVQLSEEFKEYQIGKGDSSFNHESNSVSSVHEGTDGCSI